MFILRTLWVILLLFSSGLVLAEREEQDIPKDTTAKTLFWGLWETIAKAGSAKIADDVFENWQVPEKKILQSTIQRFEHFLTNESPPYVRESLFQLFGRAILAQVVEGHSQSVARQFAASKSAVFISEDDYKNLNTAGSKLDGLIVRFLEGDRAGQGVIIDHAVEAKSGEGGFSASQAESFLKYLRVNGICLRKGEEIEVFSPGKIFFETEGAEELVSVKKLSFLDFERRITLFSTREHPNFQGVEVSLGIDYKNLKSAVLHFIDRTVLRVHQTHAANMRHEPIPIISGFMTHSFEELRDPGLAQQISTWFETHENWPMHAAKEPGERPLRLLIDAVGGQMTIFANYLNIEQQNRLIAIGRYPAIVPFRSFLFACDPNGIVAERVLGLFFQIYAKKEVLDTKAGELPPTLKSLIAKNKGWKKFAENEAWRKLLSPAPGCHNAF